MSTATHEALMQAKVRAQEQKRNIQRTTACQAEIVTTTAEIESVKQQLVSHQHVLDRLESLSLTHLISSIMHNREERAKDENEAVLRLALQRDTLTATLDRLSAEKAELDHRQTTLQSAQSDYEALLRERERVIEQMASSAAQDLRLVERQESDLRSEMKETQEAYDVAQQALGALRRCGDSVRSAENWGTWDMLGGGLLVTAVKRDKMGDAQSHIGDAQYYLRKLKREMNDLSWNLDIQIDSGGFLKFADYVFDGFFVDLAVERQLEGAANQVSQQTMRLERLVEQLAGRKRAVESKIVSVKAEWADIIESVE